MPYKKTILLVLNKYEESQSETAEQRNYPRIVRMITKINTF